ncbi:DUF1048 domain-containing protein [Actinotalea sp. C106]|uniref:DUF1048 domain-containing protein n=1 Tax=Actinotalea sp. C106 TaxID=2908644 RepID=UPI002028CB18|nr:DUF1048 domain-containing protein [Actinotalea sp. C106]
MEPRPRRSYGAEIDVQIERIDRYWSKRDLTTAERYERLDELREHLERAAAEGRSPEEVLGPDPVAFAAEWDAARRPYSWAGAVMIFLGTLLLSVGAYALILRVVPWGEGDRVPGDSLVVGVAVGVAFGVFGAAQDAFRAYRHRFSRRSARVGAVLGGLLLLLGLGLVWTLLRGTGISVPWPAAVVLIVLGAALTALHVRWSNRARARRRGVTS